MFCPRTQRSGRRSCPHRHRVRTGLFKTEVSVAGKRNFQGGDKEADTALEIQERRRGDKISLGNPADSGLIARFGESRLEQECVVGPRRAQMQQFQRLVLSNRPKGTL